MGNTLRVYRRHSKVVARYFRHTEEMLCEWQCKAVFCLNNLRKHLMFSSLVGLELIACRSESNVFRSFIHSTVPIDY